MGNTFAFIRDKGILLGLVLIISIFLRVYSLDNVPPALFGDEVDVGYQAFSLLETGKDLSGRVLPFYLRSLSEFRTPLYIYSAVPFIGIFGLNEWGVRLPAAFWGVISILGIYLLARKIFNKNIALLAALFLGISPWHLQYSRASFEVTMLLSFLIFGTYFFYKSFEKKFFLILAILLFGLTFYIYSTAIVFTPIFFMSLLILNFKEIKESLLQSKILIGLSILTALVCMVPLFWSLYSGEAKGRFNLISIFQESVLIDKINLARKGQEFFTLDGNLKKIDPTFEAFFHSKYLTFGQVFSLNYLQAFSFDFL